MVSGQLNTALSVKKDIAMFLSLFLVLALPPPLHPQIAFTPDVV